MLPIILRLAVVCLIIICSFGVLALTSHNVWIGVIFLVASIISLILMSPKLSDNNKKIEKIGLTYSTILIIAYIVCALIYYVPAILNLSL